MAAPAAPHLDRAVPDRAGRWGPLDPRPVDRDPQDRDLKVVSITPHKVALPATGVDPSGPAVLPPEVVADRDRPQFTHPCGEALLVGLEL